MVTRTPLLAPLEVGDIERHQLGAAGRQRHAEGQQRPVAQRRQPVARDGAEQQQDESRRRRALCGRAA